MVSARQTKYSVAVADFMRATGHATNAQILTALRDIYPELSATTVHRLTSRLVERGQLAYAPVTTDNATRFDTNLTPHDHFQCVHCDNLRDIEIPQPVLDQLQKLMGDCRFTGRLTLQGECTHCIKKEES